MATNSPTESKPDAPKGISAVYSILLPPLNSIWQQVRQTVPEKSTRMDFLASLICQDPAIVMELLKTSNSMFFSSGRPPVTTMKTAIERLGVDAAIQTLDEMKKIPPITNPGISIWFEYNRQRCKRAAKVSRIFCDTMARTLSDDAEAVGGLLHIGELLAVAHFQEQYVKIADDLRLRAKILYKLEKDLKFSTEQIGVTYLRRIGIPEVVIFAVDSNAQTKTPSRAPLRPLCTAASELVIAFESEKFDRFAPESNSIPPKSTIRMLKMTDAQYAQIYEQAKVYLEEDNKNPII